MPQTATPTSKSLREKELVPLAKEIRRMADLVNNEKRDFTAEERQKWEQLDKDYNSLRARIEVMERGEKVDADMAAPAGATDIGRQDLSGKRSKTRPQVNEEDRALALQGWMRSQMGYELRKKHVAAIDRVNRTVKRRFRIQPNRRFLDIPLTKNYRHVRRQYRGSAMARRAEAEGRALAVNVNTAGGYTIPEGFVSNLEVALLQYGGVLEVADVMRTDSGQDLPWPTVNDTTNKGARLTENTTVGQQDVTMGQVIFHAYKYTSKLVLVPAELLEDSAFDLAEVLAELLGIRLGRVFADDFTVGIGGAGAPQGVVTGATVGVTAASSTAIAADELYTLKHSVDPAYRKDPSFGWMMHDQVLLYIKKLKDGLGRYLWQSSLAEGRPDTIDGDPLTINQSMASSVATGNTTVLAGAFSKFKVRWVNQMRLRRLVERYADSDQEGFVAFMRADARMLDAGTHPIKSLKQP
jgi:HK97 family phage major capsid protein